MVLITLLLAVPLIILLTPSSVWAWGPATHLEIARTLLADPGLVRGVAGELIRTFPHDFIYGCVSADIVVGKNLVDEVRHCHNWNTGLRLLERAGSGARRAFASGYLSHLAADTVAHNDFVPEMILRSFSTLTLRHLYWELRFDALAGREAWDLQHALAPGAGRENHMLLDSVIRGTPLSFRTNRALFSSFLLLNRLRHWQGMLRLVHRSSRWPLPEGLRERFLSASVEAAADILNNEDRALCLGRDPTGRKSLGRAVRRTRMLRASLRRGGDWQGELEEALREIEAAGPGAPSPSRAASRR